MQQGQDRVVSYPSRTCSNLSTSRRVGEEPIYREMIILINEHQNPTRFIIGLHCNGQNKQKALQFSVSGGLAYVHRTSPTLFLSSFLGTELREAKYLLLEMTISLSPPPKKKKKKKFVCRGYRAFESPQINCFSYCRVEKERTKKETKGKERKSRTKNRQYSLRPRCKHCYNAPHKNPIPPKKRHCGPQPTLMRRERATEGDEKEDILARDYQQKRKISQFENAMQKRKISQFENAMQERKFLSLRMP